MRFCPFFLCVVTLGAGASTLGGSATTLGGVHFLADWLALNLLRCPFAFAISFFAVAILVNSSLTRVSASAVLLPAGMLPFNALVSYWAAATTCDSGEIVGFVMYWCLKRTVLLILVARVRVMYTL